MRKNAEKQGKMRKLLTRLRSKSFRRRQKSFGGQVGAASPPPDEGLDFLKRR